MVVLDPEKCMLCGGCAAVCPADCITVYEACLEIGSELCTDCGACIKICPMGAMAQEEGAA